MARLESAAADALQDSGYIERLVESTEELASQSGQDRSAPAEPCGQVALAGQLAFESRSAGQSLKDAFVQIVAPLPPGKLRGFVETAVFAVYQGTGPTNAKEAYESAQNACAAMWAGP